MLAVKNTLADTCTKIAWEDILRTMMIVTQCYFILIGMALTNSALMMVSKHALLNIQYIYFTHAALADFSSYVARIFSF